MLCRGTVFFVKTLDVVAANLWRENKQINQDLSLFKQASADVVACNESRNWIVELVGLEGYRALVPERPGNARNNVILVKDDVRVVSSGYRKMCDKVGSSPDRWATWVIFWWEGVKVALICTHANSHVQEGPNDPHELPRVEQLIRHVKNLGELRGELKQQVDTVIVAGDLNWDYVPGPMTKQWYYSPRRYFSRWGMITNWAFENAPSGGSKGRRQIDYVAWVPTAFRVVGQSWVRGEHSDHRWVKVRLHPRHRRFWRWRRRHARG